MRWSVSLYTESRLGVATRAEVDRAKTSSSGFSRFLTLDTFPLPGLLGGVTLGKHILSLRPRHIQVGGCEVGVTILQDLRARLSVCSDCPPGSVAVYEVDQNESLLPVR